MGFQSSLVILVSETIGFNSRDLEESKCALNQDEKMTGRDWKRLFLLEALNK